MEFEESLNKLEDIVKKLEKGEVSLEESLPLFEEGMKILSNLKDYLADAEQRDRRYL